MVCGAVLARAVRSIRQHSHRGQCGRAATRRSTRRVLVVIWLAALAGLRTRSPKYIGAGIEEYRRVVAASFWTFGAVAIAELLLKLEVSRGYLAVALPVGILGLVLSRWQWRGYVVRQRRSGRLSDRGVGCRGPRCGRESRDRADRAAPTTGITSSVSLSRATATPRGEHLTINGRQVPDHRWREPCACRRSAACGADTVAIAGTDHFGVKGIRRLIWELEPMGVELVVSPGVMDVALSRLVMRPIAGLPLLVYRQTAVSGREAVPEAGVRLLLRVGGPHRDAFRSCLTTAIAIKLTSKGPVFYNAERIGIDGKPFMMLKFRTMVEDADKELANLLARQRKRRSALQDPRTIRASHRSVGILRRFSIDELPQFINVLRQEMSVVGPRPPLRREVEAYDDDVQRRLLVKPGVTGLWQVSGRSDLPWDKAVRLDLSYVDNWSMVGDILIIAKTVRAVLSAQEEPTEVRCRLCDSISPAERPGPRRDAAMREVPDRRRARLARADLSAAPSAV